MTITQSPRLFYNDRKQTMKVVTAHEMKLLDQRASADYAIPSLLLMENAARGLVDQIERKFGILHQKRVVILAGCGNNGGDGLAAARHLRMRGARVVVYLLSPIEKVEGDAKTSLCIWMQSGGILHDATHLTWKKLAEDLKHSDLIVDALLGTGTSRPVEGNYSRAISLINQSGTPTVAVDIPSGISADTGEILGVAVKADYTFTMGLPKRGLFMQAGLEHRGIWDVIDIGLPAALIEQSDPPCQMICPSDLIHLIPPRSLGAHKGDFGHLLVIAGSLGKQGAAMMSSLAALRCGTGLVTCAHPMSLHVGAHPMEVMTYPLPESQEGTLSLSALPLLLKAMEGKGAVAIGPGLSRNKETAKLIQHLIMETPHPMVVDADGINALALDLSILKRKRGELILTPHPGEMGRLIGKGSEAVQKDRFKIATDFAQKWGVTLILKGAHTLIATPDGQIRINNTGNPWMATAGTGDVLTGMIAGWIAQGISPVDAAGLGVYLHGLAGDLAKQPGLIASDLIKKIPEAMKRLK